MAKVITTELQHSGASGANITLDSSKNVTCENNLTVDGTTTLTGAVTLPAGTTSDTLSFRNLIINGAMQVAQRGTSVAWAANGYLSCDRWNHNINSSAGRWTAKQTADGPDGFRRCLELDVTTADTSIAAAEHALIQYKWEGQDVQQLAKGTSGAKKFTVSFYVKGNGSATYMCEFFDRTNTRLTRQQFSVTSSWTRVVLTFNNETSNGTLNDDNSHELDMSIWLHAGSDFTSGTYTANTWSGQTNANRAVGISSLFSSTDNYFRITGVQVEAGEAATDFEHRSYGDELARCQRYYTLISKTSGGQDGAGGNQIGWGYCESASTFIGGLTLPVTMRAQPSLDYVSGSSYYTFKHGGTTQNVTSLVVSGNNNFSFGFAATGLSGGTAGAAGRWTINNSSGYLAASAEL